MSQTLDLEIILQRLCAEDPRYDAKAYLFALGALQHAAQALSQPRHLTGTEVALAARDLAIDQFGLMAPQVLDHWGIRSTLDIGVVIFRLVHAGVLSAQPEDRVEDFADVYEFDEAFFQQYPWCSRITQRLRS